MRESSRANGIEDTRVGIGKERPPSRDRRPPDRDVAARPRVVDGLLERQVVRNDVAAHEGAVREERTGIRRQDECGKRQSEQPARQVPRHATLTARGRRASQRARRSPRRKEAARIERRSSPENSPPTRRGAALAEWRSPRKPTAREPPRPRARRAARRGVSRILAARRATSARTTRLHHEPLRLSFEHAHMPGRRLARERPSRLHDDLAAGQLREQAERRHGVGRFLPCLGQAHIRQRGRILVPIVEPRAGDSRVARQRLLVLVPHAPAQPDAPVERCRIRKLERHPRHLSQALDPRQVAIVEVRVEDGAPSPEGLGVLTEIAPHDLEESQVVARLGLLQSPRRAVDHFAQRAKLALRILLLEEPHEGRRREDLVLAKGPPDPPRRGDRHGRQEHEAGQPESPAMRADQLQTQKGHHPQDRCLRQGSRQLARGDSQRPAASHHRNPDAARRLRCRRRGDRQESQRNAGAEDPARQSRPRPKIVEREAGEHGQRESQQHGKFFGVAQRQGRERAAPGLGQQRRRNRKQHRDEDEPSREASGREIELARRHQGDQGKGPGV